MQINEFIDKAIAFFGFAEKRLNELPGNTKQFEADLATAKQTIGSLEAQNKDLTIRAEAAEGTAAKLTAELAEMPQKIEAAANDIARAQGVPPVREEVKPGSTAGKTKEQLWTEYNQIDANDHTARRNFWLENKSQM